MQNFGGTNKETIIMVFLKVAYVTSCYAWYFCRDPTNL